jgi:hypothetical protein
MISRVSRGVSSSSVHGTGAFVPADVAVRLGKDAPVLLQRRDEVRHELHGHDHLGPHRRADDVVGFGLFDLFSDSGITSQKVRVKSNGVCAIEQKFE